MSKTLSAFMLIVAVMLILISLYYGVVYKELELRHHKHSDIIDSYQVKPL